MKATTSSQIEASRLNGQKSQGPITAEGKAISAKNSFKHGLYAKHAVLDEENAAALDQLRYDLRVEHQPINNIEGMLVEELAMNYWSINRYRTLEVNALNNNAAIPTVIAIHRFLTASQRAFHRVLKELQQLQKQRGFVPQNAESTAETETAVDTQPELEPAISPLLGFVPQKSAVESAALTWQQALDAELLNATDEDIDKIADRMVNMARSASRQSSKTNKAA